MPEGRAGEPGSASFEKKVPNGPSNQLRQEGGEGMSVGEGVLSLLLLLNHQQVWPTQDDRHFLFKECVRVLCIVFAHQKKRNTSI